MNEAQTHAIAQADAELNNAALPTYTELTALLGQLKTALKHNMNGSDRAFWAKKIETVLK